MARKISKKLKSITNKSLTSYLNPQSSIAAQFRAIRNNIEFATHDKPLRTIAITSPNAGEGKTTAAVNLAISKAQRGSKVLVIDANIQNPMIHDIFSMKLSPGLINVLSGQSELNEAISPTEMGRLDIMPFGTHTLNAIEMLASNKMDELIEQARQQYEYIIIDTAPVLDVLDANMLTNKGDGVILVLKGGKTQRELALKAKRSLQFFAKSNIVGIILNEKVW